MNLSFTLSRRSAIRVGGASLFGLTFPQLLAATEKPARKARVKSIIFLHQWGGPGQHETFDPKPDAPDNVRGWFGTTKTKVPGVIFGEKLPKLAAMADKLTVIRNMQHSVSMKNHNSAGYYSLTGVPPADRRPAAPRLARTLPGLRQRRQQAPPVREGCGHVRRVPARHFADGSGYARPACQLPGQDRTTPLFVTDDPNAEKLPAARTERCPMA